MLVEILRSFFLLRSFELSNVFRLTVGKAISVRARFILEPSGPLPRRAKIDHLGHCRPHALATSNFGLQTQYRLHRCQMCQEVGQKKPMYGNQLNFTRLAT
jgi:hypothetical protein